MAEMSVFEFILSLFVILLGLAMAEVLTGLATVVQARCRVRLGWPTGLLAALVIADLTLFWRVAWRARAEMPDTSAALFGVLIVSGLYYFAAALVFPDDLDEREELDSHFFAEKNKVLACIFLANVIAYAGRYAIMGWRSFALFTWSDWVEVIVFMTACAAAIAVKARKSLIALLALMLFVDLSDPVMSVIEQQP